MRVIKYQCDICKVEFDRSEVVGIWTVFPKDVDDIFPAATYVHVCKYCIEECKVRAKEMKAWCEKYER